MKADKELKEFVQKHLDKAIADRTYFDNTLVEQKALLNKYDVQDIIINRAFHSGEIFALKDIIEIIEEGEQL